MHGAQSLLLPLDARYDGTAAKYCVWIYIGFNHLCRTFIDGQPYHSR